jgi:formylglycine-generating enzyme required for sulfatase activity
MVFIAGTTFSMGSITSRFDVERPRYTAKLDSFYIDVYETTNQEYLTFIKATGRKPPKNWKDGTFAVGETNYPVVGVSYEDAEAYARWKGKRLPTEEEWEWAARGSSGGVYPWGGGWDTRYSNADSVRPHPLAVGSSSGKSPFGLYDMSGNAWEWTSSDFKPYPGGTLPKEYIGKSNLKTMRGGSFSTPREMATTTYRIGWPATGAGNYDQAGFRLAMDAPN